MAAWGKRHRACAYYSTFWLCKPTCRCCRRCICCRTNALCFAFKPVATWGLLRPTACHFHAGGPFQTPALSASATAVLNPTGASPLHLDDQAVAGEQRRREGVEHVVEGVVPGHDGAHLDTGDSSSRGGPVVGRCGCLAASEAAGAPQDSTAGCCPWNGRRHSAAARERCGPVVSPHTLAC